jgi:hypothetical protein
MFIKWCKIHKYKINIIVMCPLPVWEDHMTIRQFLLRHKDAQRTAAIFSKVAMKFKITTISTVGTLENQPIIQEGSDECYGYWTAATKMDGYEAATRNMNGTFSREYYRRQGMILDMIADVSMRAAKILENWEKFKQGQNRTKMGGKRHSYEAVVMAKEMQRGLEF